MLQCSAGHKFLYPRTVTEHTMKPVYSVDSLKGTCEPLVDWCEVQTKRCPVEGCGSLSLSEVVEEPVKEAVSNVYVYELTSGSQTELDKLLASGYKIVNRYSKQYHLEKVAEAAKA